MWVFGMRDKEFDPTINNYSTFTFNSVHIELTGYNWFMSSFVFNLIQTKSWGSNITIDFCRMYMSGILLYSMSCILMWRYFCLYRNKRLKVNMNTVFHPLLRYTPFVLRHYHKVLTCYHYINYFINNIVY